jgi:RNA polymerase sigma factor (TIGR02999 family)
MSPEQSQVTVLLRAWKSGDAAALDRLTPLIYNEMRRIARNHIRRERVDNTLQTTALAHEAFVRLVRGDRGGWQDRAHFFAVCAHVMRGILVDAARARRAVKRGGAEGVNQATAVNLDEIADLRSDRSSEFVALDEALNELAELDERKARVVELRFFGGLSVEETAEVLGISPQSVMRDWKLARAWLLAQLRGDG